MHFIKTNSHSEEAIHDRLFLSEVQKSIPFVGRFHPFIGHKGP
jgi:hypothetical protein